MDVKKEYISFPWITLSASIRTNFTTAQLNGTIRCREELAKFHAKYDDGFIMFENMKYYDWFVIKWS
jgi:hypothetical protein